MPIGMGVLTSVLTVWDIHNWRVIESMGMAWDTGAPGWPYQASDIFLRLINFPAFVIAMPFSNLFGWLAPKHHFLVFPASLILWCLLGIFIDRRLATPPNRRNWLAFVILAFSSGLLLWAAIDVLGDTYKWWSRYGGATWRLDILTALTLTRLSTPALWCLMLFLFFFVAAKNAMPSRAVRP